MINNWIYIVVLIGCFLWNGVNAQEIKGKIIDAETQEPLPMVNILYNANKALGTSTDFDGHFTIPKIQDIASEISISFIGYNTLNLAKTDVPVTGKVWVIELKSSTETLEEIDLLAGENPALRIVRNAIKNKDLNNPKKYKSYTYHSYNKNVITALPTYQDSLFQIHDTANSLGAVTQTLNRHLMVMESVTKKYYKRPDKNHEIILGTKISGFNEPFIGTVPDGFQNFGFYDNTIPLLNNRYLNPIADGADSKYFYILKDTTYANGDTTFIMDYYPNIGSNFDGFTGELHLNSNKWAIEYISAYPSDKGKLYIGMVQWYKLIDGAFWFPSHLRFNLVIEKLPVKGTAGLMHGDSYLDSVIINQPISDSVFSHIYVDIDKDAGKKNNDYWLSQRVGELSEQETQTYNHMDSLGNKYKFDALLLMGRNFYDGYLSFQNFDVDYKKLVAYNDYEGLRLGMGLYTNQDISEHFKTGAYVGHGSLDNDWKYGASFKYFIKKQKDNNLFFEYYKDVLDPGGIRLRYWVNIGGFANQFLNVRMDNIEAYGGYVNWRFFKYLQVTAGARTFTLKPNYDYTFNPTYDGGDPQLNFFGFGEALINFRWVYKEQYRKNFGQRISLGSKYPVIVFNYARGINGFGQGQFDYNKLELGIQFDAFTKGLGRTLITLEGGYIDAALPYSMNFSGRPSYKPDFSVVVKNTFQTMRFNEFSSTQYAALFFMHDFKSLLFKAGYFKPEFRIFQGISFGTLSNPEVHGGEPFKTLKNGFFESGLVIDNIIRINIFNAGYWGFGAGVFYRYGPNALANERDNFAIKLAFMYSFN